MDWNIPKLQANRGMNKIFSLLASYQNVCWGDCEWCDFKEKTENMLSLKLNNI